VLPSCTTFLLKNDLLETRYAAIKSPF